MTMARAARDGAPPAGTVDPVRRLLSPGWLALHVVVIAVTAAMLWLGYWQWTGGLTGHTARNTGYALQWWVFAAFTVYFWIRLMRDALHGKTPGAPSQPRAPRRSAAPPPAGFREYRLASAPVVADDSDLGRYNAYLASLSEPASEPSAPASTSASTSTSGPASASAPGSGRASGRGVHSGPSDSTDSSDRETT